MTKKPVRHPSLQELMESGESLKGMTDEERQRWIERTTPTKEDLDYHTLDIWNRAILSRPHINRHSFPGTGFGSNRRYAIGPEIGGGLEQIKAKKHVLPPEINDLLQDPEKAFESELDASADLPVGIREIHERLAKEYEGSKAKKSGQSFQDWFKARAGHPDTFRTAPKDQVQFGQADKDKPRTDPKDLFVRPNPHPALGDERMERPADNPSGPRDWLYNRRHYPKLYPGGMQPIIDRIPARVMMKTRSI